MNLVGVRPGDNRVDRVSEGIRLDQEGTAARVRLLNILLSGYYTKRNVHEMYTKLPALSTQVLSTQVFGD